MGWSLGYDKEWERDVGYGVPAHCDHPRCDEVIDRGLGYVCGSDIYGGDHGCGLHFCGGHLFHRTPRGADRSVMNCKRCMSYKPPYDPKPDHPSWAHHKLTDPSWEEWRLAHPEALHQLQSLAKDYVP